MISLRENNRVANPETRSSYFVRGEVYIKLVVVHFVLPSVTVQTETNKSANI